MTFLRLEERDGVVLDVDGSAGVFRARLIDPRGTAPDEEVEIEMDQVSRGDLELVQEGALFFWSIGYLVKVNGNRQLALRVDFRRFSPLRQGSAARAMNAARSYMEDMGWT